MLNRIAALLIVFCTFVLVSCHKEPEQPEQIVFTPADPTIGQSVRFEGPGNNASYTWYWDFGDGTFDSISGSTAYHAYNTAQTYYISLYREYNGAPDRNYSTVVTVSQ